MHGVTHLCLTLNIFNADPCSTHALWFTTYDPFPPSPALPSVLYLAVTL